MARVKIIIEDSGDGVTVETDMDTNTPDTGGEIDMDDMTVAQLMARRLINSIDILANAAHAEHAFRMVAKNDVKKARH